MQNQNILLKILELLLLLYGLTNMGKSQKHNREQREQPLIIPNYGIQPEKRHLQHISIPMPMHLYSRKELLHTFLG